jgi:protocatechuate 3,4-dioxygenase beta subunit
VSRTVLLVLAVIVVGAVVALALWLGDGGAGASGSVERPVETLAEVPPGVSPATALPEGAAAAGSVEPLHGRPDPSATQVLPPPGEQDPGPVATLRGRVLRVDSDVPVAGVAVRVRFAGRPILLEGDPVAFTDDDGRFWLTFSETAQLGGFLVAAGPDSAGLVHWERLQVPLGGEAEILLRVGRGGAVSGQVQDVHGHGVPGASVLLWSRPSYLVGDDPPDRVLATLSDGSFSCEAVGTQFTLEPAADGHACARRILGELAEGERADGLTLLLAPALQLSGQVTTLDGAPLVGVTLSVTTPRVPSDERLTATSGVYRRAMATQKATSADDGRFVVPGLVAGLATVEARLDGYTTLETEHDPAEGPLTLVLDRGAALAGVVLGADGSAVAGASVVVRGAGSQSAATAVDGRFLIEGLVPDTSGRLRVLADGHALQVVQPVEVSADETRFVEVRLEPALALAGRVVDAEGQALSGALIEIEGDREEDLGGTVMIPKPTWERAVGRSAAMTGDDGAFRIDELYAGSFKLSARHPDDREVVGTWQVASGSEQLELVLDADQPTGVVLVGQVTDAQTGLPVTTFQITPMRPMGSGGYGGSNHSFTDLDGRYMLSGLEPGPYRINASADGYAPSSLPEQDWAEGEHRVDLALRPTRSLHLRCVDPAGEPLADVSLNFLDEQGHKLMVAIGPGSRTTMLSTDEQGEARAYELPAGLVTVSAQVSGTLHGIAQPTTIDLWNELPGIHTLVLQTEVVDAPGRQLSLSVGSSTTDPGVGAFGGSEEDRAKVMDLFQQGLLRPLVDRDVMASYTTAAGLGHAPRIYGPREDGWGRKALGAGDPPTAPGVLELEISEDGGTVLLEASGHASRRLDIPAGEGDLVAFVVLVGD